MTYVEALQTTLAGEHAAVYVFGVLGAQTSQSSEPALYEALTAAYTAHRSARDRVTTALFDLDEEPVAAEVAYTVPPDLTASDVVTRLALRLERGAAATYAFLVANSPVEARRLPVELLTNTAVRELTFRGTPETFPGSGEYADH